MKPHYDPQKSAKNSFKKTSTGSSSKSSFRQNPRPRKIVIEGYNLGPDVQKNTISGTEVGDGNNAPRKVELKIAPEKFDASRKSQPGILFYGGMIDDRMAQNVEVGDTVIVDGCITEKNNKDTGVSHMVCNWITHDKAPEKSRRTIITAQSWDNRVRSFQSYEETERNINPATEEGAEYIRELETKMNDILAAYKNGERSFTYGVKFHAMTKTGEVDGVNQYQVIDRTPPFDWISAKKDADGNIIEGGEPMSGDKMVEYLEGYLDYIYGSPDQSAPNAEKGLVGNGVLPAGSEIIVEVMVYRAYTAAPLSLNMELGNPKSPLYNMCNKVTKFGLSEEDRGYSGKNWARSAYLMFTPDARPDKKGDDWKERNLIKRAFIFGKSVDIDAAFPAFDGGRISIHPSLAAINDSTYQASAENEAVSSVSSDIPESSSSVTLTPVDVFDDGENDNYFMNSVASATGDVPSVGTAEADVAENAEAIAEDGIEAAEATAEGETAGASKGGFSRFNRRTT